MTTEPDMPGEALTLEDSGAPSGDVNRLEVHELEIGLRNAGPDVVSEVSFSVSSGSITGLVGESGSGKTTVALALLGHARRGLVIRSGQVIIDGVDVLKMDHAALRATRGAKVAYVPQDPGAALNPALRIGTQLKEALTAHPAVTSDPEARVAEVLAEVRLEPSREILRRYPHQLSGGQQQRVALAMAFACRPSLIVLDEPTTGLDVSTQRHVLDTVRSLCRSYGVAGVYVSHDLAVVAGLVQQVVVMYAGRVIELGATRDVFETPIHPYTRGLLAAVPSLGRAEGLTGIEGQPPRPGSRPAGCTFAPRCSFARDVCRSGTPPLEPVNGRLVRCIRATELESGPPRAAIQRNAMGETESVLTVRGLAARYGDAVVLNGIDLEVRAQQCVAVVGESGSGKTTLARCIVGMHANWTGDVSYHGDTLARAARQRPQHVLKQIQYIFQNPYTSLNPRKTIGQILSQPLEHFFDLSSRERATCISRVLEDVSLGPAFTSRFPDQLSGGERQRVAIARALVVEPDVLVCDEVTSALDVSVQAVIVELLRRLQEERRLSLIFITHNLALLRSVAQSAIVLCDGHIVEDGRSRADRSEPARPLHNQADGRRRNTVRHRPKRRCQCLGLKHSVTTSTSVHPASLRPRQTHPPRHRARSPHKSTREKESNNALGK